MEYQINREIKNMMVLIEYYLSKAGIGLSNEDGQGLIEYVLIGALISIFAIGAMMLLGPAIVAQFTAITNAL
jgi:Flp pilus assembly pilin Flp